MAIKPEHVVSLQGKDHVLYAGLLAEAHERGLRGIETTLLQVPGAENEYTAIVKATVIMAEGETFTDIGDASPRNVSSRMATALIRFASTRAKGRALRDAVNVGVAMVEELPELEATEPANGKAHAAVTSAERETVPPPVQTPKPAGAEGCAICGAVLTAGQQKVSQANFQQPLCPLHQREALAAKKAAGGTPA